MLVTGSDAVGITLQFALDGLSQRQNVISNNIANVDTVNFRSTTVDFEDSLKAAIADGDPTNGPTQLDIMTEPTDTPVGANGNNVDLRKETMAAMQTSYQYSMISRAVNDRYDLVKIAAAG